MRTSSNESRNCSEGSPNFMAKPDKRRLMAAALKARLRSVSPYSGFKVGAALLAVSGKIIPGANVESASYGLTCCAERIALFKALTEGERQFAAIAVTAQVAGGPMPCGACRQLLAEFAPDAKVWVSDSRQPDNIAEFSVAQLLPKAFLMVPQAGVKKTRQKSSGEAKHRAAT